MAVTGEPPDDVWVFSANGDPRVIFQFLVSTDTRRPPRIAFIDDRGGKMLVEDGVRRAR